MVRDYNDTRAIVRELHDYAKDIMDWASYNAYEALYSQNAIKNTWADRHNIAKLAKISAVAGAFYSAALTLAQEIDIDAYCDHMQQIRDAGKPKDAEAKA